MRKWVRTARNRDTLDTIAAQKKKQNKTSYNYACADMQLHVIDGVYSFSEPSPANWSTIIFRMAKYFQTGLRIIKICVYESNREGDTAINCRLRNLILLLLLLLLQANW